MHMQCRGCVPKVWKSAILDRSNYTVFLPCPVEVVHPAKQGDMYVMPLSEQTGSHSDVEQEQSWLH